MNEFYCEHPDHPRRTTGASTIGDQYVVTVDIMRADGKERMARVGPAISRWARRRHPGGLAVVSWMRAPAARGAEVRACAAAPR